MKLEYQTPSVEIIEFETEDVITTSVKPKIDPTTGLPVIE